MKHETIQGAISFLGGCAAFLLGGFDSLLVALLVVMGADWITGVLKALKKGKFSAVVGLWGLVNKLVALIVVVTVNFIQAGSDMVIPLRETVVIMLLINEGISVLGNASTFIKGLEPLTKYFEHVKINIVKIFTVQEVGK
jgi:toxin secretion/phage lysis holin